MMSDKNPKPPLMSKEKIVAIIILVVVVIVIWQVIGLLGFGKVKQVAIPPAKESAAMPMNAQKAGPSQPMMATGSTASSETIQEASVVTETPLMENQSETQKALLGKISELQMLRIDREIQETKQAIASSKLETDKAEKSTKALTAAPALPSNYSSALVNPAQNAEPGKSAPAAFQEYVVISVSMKFNKWMAVLGNQGKLFSVSIGDVLPVDGSKVIDISNDGVVLEKEDKERKIAMVSSI